MKLTRAHQWFICGAALGATAWIALWPRRAEPVTPIVTDVPPAVSSWSPEALNTALDDLKAAKTNAEKLAAINRLNEIPIDEIPTALASIETVNNRQLTLAAGTLLTRWASKDGPGAMSWAWNHLGKSQAWNEAFKEMGPAWAWRDPDGFSEWIKASMKRRTPDFPLPTEAANASDEPVFSTDQISVAARWLVTGKPSAAFEILEARPGWSSDDHKLVDLLRTVEQVREALLAFDDVEKIDGTKPGTHQLMPMSLLSRWKEIDPEDFSRSSYHSILVRTKFEEIENAVASWKSTSPDERLSKADATLAASDSLTRQFAISKIAKEWSALDAASAAAWLESLPDTDSKVRDKTYAAEISAPIRKLRSAGSPLCLLSNHGLR